MRKAKLILTEALLKKMSKDPACLGQGFSDGGCRGVSIWIAKDGIVTFKYKTRVKAKGGKRVPIPLGTWGPTYTLEQARDAANTKRTEIAVYGHKAKVDSKTVGESIPIYETARRNKDPQTSRKGKPLSPKWGEHITRFKKIFKPLLDEPVISLTRTQFTDCMDAYGVEWAKENGKDWEPRVLRTMMVGVMPMLRWYTKRYKLDPVEIEDLVPPDYDPDFRYLLPGEWQACAPHVDALKNESGLFERFILLTCVRSEQALKMTWREIQWGNMKKATAPDGTEHNVLIWIPPRKHVKARDQKGGEKLPRRILLVGDSLAILARLREIYEANKALPENEGYEGVFTKRMCMDWRNERTTLQRSIEVAAGTASWDRMTLRHTHATYLRLLRCSPRIRSMSMNHTPDKEGASSTTDRYSGYDASRQANPDDPLICDLMPWHLRLQKLLRDIERGNVEHSPDLARVIAEIEDEQLTVDMCELEGGPSRDWIKVKPMTARLALVK